MYARAVDDAAKQLHDLRLEERADTGTAAIALGAAVAATRFAPSLALPLLAGGGAVAVRAVHAFWQRWNLLERLTHDRDAYAIDEVRTEAEKAGTIENRRQLARTIRSLLRDPVGAAATCLACAIELAELASELEDEELVLDPLLAVECQQLFTGGLSSQLFNPDALQASVRKIRAGFARTRTSRTPAAEV